MENGETLPDEVQQPQVPSEVREWLKMTFTPSAVKVGTDKLSLRSVATAIRATIRVERLFRRSSSLAALMPPNVLLFLKGIESWNFDVFYLNEISEGHALKYVVFEVLQRYDLIHKLKITPSALEGFMHKIQHGYGRYGNPYHSAAHAADVTQTTFYLLHSSGLERWLSDFELFSVLFAAIIHDLEHTGTSNLFHINTRSDLAIMYNDRSVLENHHVSAAFQVLQEADYNITSNMDKEEFRAFRQMVIDIVLATDMSSHFEQMKEMKQVLANNDSIDKTKAMSLLVHCADISNPAKQWNLYNSWTEKLFQEFFAQGDREKELELPVSPMCDRNTTHLANSQIGFIDIIVHPLFDLVGDMMDTIRNTQDSQDPGQGQGKANEEQAAGPVQRVWDEQMKSNRQEWVLRNEKKTSGQKEKSGDTAVSKSKKR